MLAGHHSGHVLASLVEQRRRGSAQVEERAEMQGRQTAEASVRDGVVAWRLDRDMVYAMEKVSAEAYKQHRHVHTTMEKRQFQRSQALPSPSRGGDLLPLLARCPRRAAVAWMAPREEGRREVRGQRYLAPEVEGEAGVSAQDLHHLQATDTDGEKEEVK